MRSPASRNIALVDFRWHGHHPSFFRSFQEELGQLSRVIPFHPRNDDDPIPPEQEMEDEVLARRWIRKWPALANLYRFARCSRRLQAYERKHQMRFDLVVFSSLYTGACLSTLLLDRFFPYCWVALSLDSDCCRRSWWERLVRWRSLDLLAAFRAQSCRALVMLDQAIIPAIERRLPGTLVMYLPEWVRTDEPNDSFPLAQEIKRRANGRTTVGCFGQFDKRKGGLDFLQTAKQSQSEPFFFVWIGALIEKSFSAAELQSIETLRRELKSNTLVLFENVADWHNFNGLIAATDVLFLCYADHAGSSNMVHTAALFHKPVLVTDGYCMADDTRRYRLGLTVARGDVASYATGLRTLCEGRAHLKPNYESYQRDHSAQRRSETLVKMLHAGGLLDQP